VNDTERMQACERVHDAAAYVLGALEESELDDYRGHLSDCAACREEVMLLQPVADSLAVGVQFAQAPEDLRARLMAVVHGEAELLRAAGHEADRPARARRRERFWLLPSLASAGALAAGLLIGALAIGGGSSVRTRVIQASVAVPAGIHADAALRQTGSHVVLDVVGLPAPPRGRIYEVWLEHGTQPPQPTDVLFSVTVAGNGSVAVPSDLKGVSKVLVTAEPLGGSLHPTRNPIIIAPV
jgi:anti-sigma factor RsiW